ncbi:tyrosine-protein kinase receptor Tie-1-like [Littorina saxatilis]|uniref:tyrosine-protein kinase receptor Tie-1-like n=1 Tax=Littorina saxatilis TaxID=31220 RepID=UPI0038B439E4
MTFESRQPWQHNESSLTLTDHLTRGKFANIYKARLKTGSGPSRIVAAKMLKPAYKEDDMLKMTAKINFFATQLGDHPNVLAFVGAVLDNKNWGPVLATELCQGGQMDKWLVSHKGQVEADTLDTLRDFAAGITNGMAYLAGKQILHRRLAARNVLLTDKLQVKVAGFGPQEKEVDEKKQTRIPAKWAAPEILRDERHTEKSDVWSYGVVLWEIFSMGQVPYSGIHSKEIGAKLKGGYRMEKPEYADNTYYNIMRTCWAEEPEGRPTFNNLCSQLGTDHYDVNYYDVNQLKS